MIDISLVIPAFLAGILMFLAPCTLPLLPGYLGFISGASMKDLEDPEKRAAARWKIFLNGLFFVIGFSGVFIILGTLAGLAGSAVGQYRDVISRVGGVLVIVFGFMMLDIVKIKALGGERRVKLPGALRRGRPLSSLVFGAVFGFGWTPCVGPILGSILLLASTSSTVGQGAFLLFVFSLGQAIPFLLVALLVGQAIAAIKKVQKYLRVVSIVGGLFLIGIGVLMVMNRVGLLLTYGYKLFEFLNYDALLEYL